MKNGKHILLITPGFPKDEDDNTCIPPLQEYLIKFKEIFPDSKFTVVALHYPHLQKNYSWNGIQVIGMGGKTVLFKKPFLWLQLIRKSKSIYKLNRFDLIHTLWFGECAFVGNILSKKFNCTHVCTLMGQDVKSTNKYLRLLKNKKIKIVALSKNQSKQYYNLTGKTVDAIIHWGIDSQTISNIERDIDLLAVGSLIALKNYSLLIRAIEKTVMLKPGINCILAGSGPEESKLMQIIIEKGLEKNITLTGLLNRKEIFKLMKRSRIFLHPSKFEGSGYVFAEALANGLNIVSFNVGYAQPHPKWFVANDDEEFIDITCGIISDKLDFNPVNLFPLDKTINLYARLYGIN